MWLFRCGDGTVLGLANCCYSGAVWCVQINAFSVLLTNYFTM